MCRMNRGSFAINIIIKAAHVNSSIFVIFLFAVLRFSLAAFVRCAIAAIIGRDLIIVIVIMYMFAFARSG